jgi:hypothetical protein
MPVDNVQVCTFWLLTRSVMDSPPTVPRARTVKLLLPPPPPLLLEEDELLPPPPTVMSELPLL